MEFSIWIPVIVAGVAAVGAVTVRAISKTRKDRKAGPIDDSQKIVEMARMLAMDMGEILKEERVQHEAQVNTLKAHIERLEAELRRQGGDPSKCNPPTAR